MDLWQVRNQAVASLSADLKRENEVIEGCFALFDECIKRFYSLAKSGNPKESFSLVCGQTILKARRLAMGSYSLCLDGLVLEAGALARSLIEAWELMIFFYQKPERVRLVFEDKPLKAGEVAKAINDGMHNDLKGLRDYYNANTSHISFQKDALVPVMMIYSKEDLKRDMRSLYSLMRHIAFDALPCLELIGVLDQALIDAVEDCQTVGHKTFGIEV